eukprot:7053245-Prymnesium_polylepis.1
MFGTNTRTRCERVLEARHVPLKRGEAHGAATRHVRHRGHVPASRRAPRNAQQRVRRQRKKV